MFEHPETLSFKRLDESATHPVRKHPFDAGLDLFANHEGRIHPDEVRVVHTGLAVSIPPYYVGLLEPRSGLAVKDGVGIEGGVIDTGYHGELMIPLSLATQEPFDFDPGDRVAQLIVLPVALPHPVFVEDLEDTERGENGIGSTGR